MNTTATHATTLVIHEDGTSETIEPGKVWIIRVRGRRPKAAVNETLELIWGTFRSRERAFRYVEAVLGYPPSAWADFKHDNDIPGMAFLFARGDEGDGWLDLALESLDVDPEPDPSDADWLGLGGA